MTTPFENTYDLSESQLLELEKAEEMMLKNDLGNAETLLLRMLEQDEDCIPVLSNLGHLYGRYLSEFETAISIITEFLKLNQIMLGLVTQEGDILRYVD